MKILVTGSNGFVGKNLVESLNNIKYGYDHSHTINGLKNSNDLTIVTFDRNNTVDDLTNAVKDCDFIFHLAGVNRPDHDDEFMKGNYGLTSDLLNLLIQYDNHCPIMLSSSIQASLVGRYADSMYGQSKKSGEELLFDYGLNHDVTVYVYRFSNLFGKWCKPNYNSVVATFCHNMANDLPITVNDPTTQLDMVYIDDVIEELLNCLNGHPTRCGFDGIQPIINENGRYCTVRTHYPVTLGEIVNDLELIKAQSKTLMVPPLPDHSFIKCLYSTYLSYLPIDKVVINLKTNSDARGSFTEVLKTSDHGQFSVNISKPGQTKGNHWHHSKWEFFIVVSGTALIQQQRIGVDEHGNSYPVHEFSVDGHHLQAVHMLPGYSHNIINTSTRDDLITLMWANECFDSNHPDTYSHIISKPEVHHES